MKQLATWFAPAITALTLMAGTMASAQTVILSQTGTFESGGIYNQDLGTDPGSYLFHLTVSEPGYLWITAHGLMDIDTYVAPAPRDHSQSLEGHNNDIGGYQDASGYEVSYTFVVPALTRRYFTTDDRWESRGIVAGTLLYEETRVLNAYFSVGAYIPAEGPFNYTLTVTRLDLPGEQPVPEPASWALMILGFGSAGLALRRRRATSFAT